MLQSFKAEAGAVQVHPTQVKKFTKKKKVLSFKFCPFFTENKPRHPKAEVATEVNEMDYYSRYCSMFT